MITPIQNQPQPAGGAVRGRTTLPTVGEDARSRQVISPVLVADLPGEAEVGYELPRTEDLRRQVSHLAVSPVDAVSSGPARCASGERLSSDSQRHLQSSQPRSASPSPSNVLQDHPLDLTTENAMLQWQQLSGLVERWWDSASAGPQYEASVFYVSGSDSSKWKRSRTLRRCSVGNEDDKPLAVGFFKRVVREFSSAKLKEAVPALLKRRDSLHAVATAVVGKIVSAPKHGDMIANVFGTTAANSLNYFWSMGQRKVRMLAERVRRPEISDNAWLRECLDGLLSYTALWGEALTMRFSSELRDFLSRIHDNIKEVAAQAGFMDLVETFVMEVALDMKTTAKQLKEQMLLETSVIRPAAATPAYLRAPVLNSASSGHSVSFFTRSHELRYIAQMHLLSRFANVTLCKLLSQNVGVWMDSRGNPIDGSVLHVSCPGEDSMFLPNMMGPPALVASVSSPTTPVTLDAVKSVVHAEFGWRFDELSKHMDQYKRDSRGHVRDCFHNVTTQIDNLATHTPLCKGGSSVVVNVNTSFSQNAMRRPSVFGQARSRMRLVDKPPTKCADIPPQMCTHLAGSCGFANESDWDA
ncbi:MAG: hypothetical protein SGPRY_008710 [Prymnesium sp.]